MKALRDQYSTPASSSSSTTPFQKNLKVPKFTKKKDPLDVIIAPHGQRWVDFARFFIEQKDHIYKTIATVKRVFYDEPKDTATVTLVFDLKLGEDAALDWVFNHSCASDAKSPIKFPWTFDPSSAEVKPIEVKVATPYGKSGLEFVQEIIDPDGNWYVNSEVKVHFKFSPYTAFPKESDHGIGCKMVVALEMLNPIATGDLTQEDSFSLFDDADMDE